MDHTLLDRLPLWSLVPLTLALVMAAVEAGYRIGRHRRRQSDREKEAPVGGIVAATLGLLAFMLAFTFGMAASRFEARRMVVLDEANAVRTAYLRASLLPDTYREKIQPLLKQYIDLRLGAVQPDEAAATAIVEQSANLHAQLWAQAEAAGKADSQSEMTAMFIESLNEVIELHAERVLLALHNRIPLIVWLALVIIAVLSMASLGYQQGLAQSRRSLAVPALALVFASVIWLIADLDRPQAGLLRVSQRPLVELQESLRKDGT